MTVNKRETMTRILWTLMGLMFIRTVAAGYVWGDYGFSEGSIGVIRASVRGVTCSIHLQCIPVSGEEDQIRVFLTATTAPSAFTAYEGRHKRRAVYRFSGIHKSRIIVNSESYSGTGHTIRIQEGKTYVISASAVFLWKTSSGKKAEGFPETYRSTVSSQKICITGRKLAEIAEGPIDLGEEIPPVVTITGSVGHTDEWDSHRKEYNEKSGAEERSPEVFWNGEKFMAKADIVSADVPEQVTVNVPGTGLSAELQQEDGVWEGELFDENAAEQFHEKGIRELSFEFTVRADGQTVRDTVTVSLDDTDRYWLLHRKGRRSGS